MAMATPRPQRAISYPTSDGKPMAETERHLLQMFYLIEALSIRYAADPEVYVCGNNFLYYEEGNPRAVLSPDCYVVHGVPKRVRDTYKLWEEGGITPNVVFEITSRKTKREDMLTKFPIYEEALRVPEYFQFDPTGDYLKPRLQGFRLWNGRYEPLLPVEGRLYSQQLGLELVQQEDLLRLYDPIREKILLTGIDLAQQVQQEMQRAEEQERRAEREAAARTEAETEIARLRAELDALRQQRKQE